LNNKNISIIIILFALLNGNICLHARTDIEYSESKKNNINKYLGECGLESEICKKIEKDIDFDQVEVIVKNTIIKESTIMNYIINRFLMKEKVNLKDYSTLVSLAQREKINLSKEDLFSLERVSS